MIGWLLAFLVHSTLWLGLAWLWTRLRPNLHARVRETIWYTAIAASLLTPTVQTLASQGATFWRVPLPATLLATAEPALRSPGAAAPEHSPRLTLDATVNAGPDAGWQGAAHWTWLAVAGALLLCYCGRLEALRRRLGPREPVEDLRARRALVQLRRRAGLRRTPLLTESENLGSPVALGFGRRAEICVPTRALHELDQDQLRALLGHELAHHLRRDTLRLGALNSLQAVLFFQPLLRVAVRAVHTAAEELCDDWAANHLDDRLAMASCLTEVAAWLLPQDHRLPVPGMARRRSQLRVRVDRLMDEQRRSEPPRRVWRRLGSVGLLVLAPWLAPAVAPASEFPREHPTAAGLAALEGESAADLYGELLAIDAFAAELESDLQLLTEELGPLADTPKYRKQLEVIRAQASQLRRTRNLLRSLLSVLPARDESHR